jgi:CxxC motif-containing protein (DUF1111 family)
MLISFFQEYIHNNYRHLPLGLGDTFRHDLHDGVSTTLIDAIARHGGEAIHVTKQFEKLKRPEQNAIIEFLKSL